LKVSGKKTQDPPSKNEDGAPSGKSGEALGEVSWLGLGGAIVRAGRRLLGSRCCGIGSDEEGPGSGLVECVFVGGNFAGEGVALFAVGPVE